MAETGNYEVGSAYVTVKPKTDDFGKDLKSQVVPALDDAGKEGGRRLGEGLRDGVSAKAVAIGNLISEAVMAAGRAAADALGQTMQQAFEGFARFEQLEGGIDILFGDNAAQVLENAQRAFETAGVSANDYMTNVTSFSAALLNSLGGDTAEAARLADMAIVDMSDNVNTFGTDIEMVQRAYQGFARNNYMMLDNLSLGFAGTRQGMEELLKAAEEISGVHYDISSLADVYEAIHVVQTEMGITGKTAAEAASTVEGSLASFSAAWSNWLTEMGKPDADLDRVTDDLVKAFEAAASNVIPAFGRILLASAKALPRLIADAFAGLPGIISDALTTLASQADANGVLTPIAEAFINIGQFAATAFETVGQLFEQMQPQMQPFLDVVAAIGSAIAETILPAVIQLIGCGIVGFIAGVAAAISGVLALLGDIVTFVQGIPGAVMGAFEAIGSGVTSAFETAANAIITAIDGVVSYFSEIPGKIVGFFSGIASDIGSAFSGIKLPGLHFEGSLNPADWLTTGKLPSIAFYATGGIVDAPHLGVVGEAGPEAIVPLSPQRLQPFGDAVADAMDGRGRTTNVYIDGAKVNSDEAVEELFYNFMRELSRLNSMGAVAYG